MHRNNHTSGPAPAQLGLWDAVSIIVGIVVGATIYETPGLIFSNVRTPWEGMAAWGLGGILALTGALCYAELATTYPRSGGDYVYLSQAYGRGVGFVFGWAQLVAVLTASIGAMAYIFASYAANVFQLGPNSTVVLASAAVVLISLINMRGVVVGKWTQNVLTSTKMLGLGGILIAGWFYGRGTAAFTAESAEIQDEGFGLAMILVLYGYGGWNDAAFVAADVKDRKRNLPLALIFGTAGVMILYLLVNAAYLSALGFDGVRATQTPAADTLQLALGEWGARGMGLLVMISALGAVNGLVFAGSRVYATLGADHSLFATLSRWHPRWGAPVWSIGVQSAVCVVMIVVAGTHTGVRVANLGLTTLGLEPVESLGRGGFDVLVKCTAPVFWSFFLLTGVALFRLRIMDPERVRPFSVPCYPVLPLIFCGTCLYMLYSAIQYAKELAWLGVLPVLLGIPLYVLSRSTANE